MYSSQISKLYSSQAPKLYLSQIAKFYLSKISKLYLSQIFKLYLYQISKNVFVSNFKNCICLKFPNCICLKFPNCISLKLQNTKNTVETAGGGEPVSLLQGSPLLMEYIRAGSTFQTKTPEHFIQIPIRKSIEAKCLLYFSNCLSLYLQFCK